jgi:hypothetical protein
MTAALASPYRPGMGLDPPYLGDRAGQLRRFDGYLLDPGGAHNLVVTGLRGVGKTVLLNRYSAAAQTTGWEVIEREFSEPDSGPEAFAQVLISDLVGLARRLSVAQRLKAVASQLAAQVLDHLTTLSVSYGGIQVGLTPNGQLRSSVSRLEDDLREAFAALADLCVRSGRRGFVLRYDEFHVIQERGNSPTLSALLAATAAVQQRGIPVLLVLCGLPPLIENLGRSKSYSERMFRVEELGNLEPPEDRRSLTEPARLAGRAYDREVVERVMEDTAGYPFFIQLWGDSLWRGTAGNVVGVADYSALRPRILDALDRGFFDSRFARIGPKDRRILLAIAEHGERSPVAAIRSARGMANSQLQPTLSRLTRSGLVYRPERGVVAFTAPMFGSYLRRRA